MVHVIEAGFRELGMYFFQNIFRLNTRTAPPHRRRVCKSIAEEIDLPGCGIVKVGCRLNCQGDGCPRPQLRTLKALDEVDKGSVIEIITDNPSVVETIPSMMDMFEGRHLATLKSKDSWHIYVCRDG